MIQYEELTEEDWKRIRIFRGLVSITVIGGVLIFMSLIQINLLVGLVVSLLLESIGFLFFPKWLLKTYPPVIHCPACGHLFEVPNLKFLFSKVTVSPLRLLEGGKGWALLECPRCERKSRKIWMKKLER